MLKYKAYSCDVTFIQNSIISAQQGQDSVQRIMVSVYFLLVYISGNETFVFNVYKHCLFLSFLILT